MIYVHIEFYTPEFCPLLAIRMMPLAYFRLESNFYLSYTHVSSPDFAYV